MRHTRYLILSALIAAHAVSAEAQVVNPATVQAVDGEETTAIPPIIIEGQREIYADPYEETNRGIYSFNKGIDDAILKPLAEGYQFVVPEWGRNRVGTFVDTWTNMPVTFANSLLQGKVEKALHAFWRFTINVTVGIGGLFDQAQYAGLEEHGSLIKINEDLGQTLAVWGVGSGPYIMLPILGPSTPRDAVGKIGDIFTGPVYYTGTVYSLSYSGGEAVHNRSELLSFTDQMEETSLDPYATLKSSFSQQRTSLIEDVKE